ncbi:phytanoyl-CoA dioxygenase family protein [Pelagibius sp. Alg239-R121]|uniref:phytanoyl-CoA dioxygenase family protein n=1 Tax=Pelagibius sp. Alg239-R121 TaxID=2993448 RepID=UPI0024A72BFB|nr:phytanoyl-CoA dioxygenase family protein [Pelagibius sp. Alg239-R121]
MTATLTAAQIEQFHRDGFLFPVEAMGHEEIRHYRRELETIEQRYSEENHEHAIGRYLLGGSANVVLPLAAQLCSHRGILDAVESLLGPDLLAWGISFFIKEPGDGKIVTWHQDLTYWGLGETSDQVTAWLALSPATPVSGCMRFVAGSHKNAVVPHRDTYSENNLLSRGQEIAVEVKEEHATNIELAPGQLSLHHGLMFHSSGPNQSSDRRIGVAIRYVNPSVRQEVGARDYALLVRGADRVRNFIHFAAPARDFDPADLLLHEEILEDKAAVNFRDVS